MKDFHRILRMQLRKLERQRVQALEATEEVKRRLEILDEVDSWNLSGEESS